MSDHFDDDGTSLDDTVLEHAPVGILAVDGSGIIVTSNATAKTSFGAHPGADVRLLVQQEFHEIFDKALGIPRTAFDLRISLDTGSKAVELIALPAEGERQTLFLSDISERIALSRQLRSSKQPSRKTMNQLHAANTTMLGYAELIAVMLEEEPVVAGERLAIVKRYHKEIRKSLDTIDRLLKLERLGGRPPEATVPLNRKHVVVVDDELAITEYVAELMRGLQHRVSAFSNSKDAIDFCRDNANAIDLVITDHNMPEHTGEELARKLHQVRAEVPVVLCSEDETAGNSEAQTYFCQKPIDINDLTRMVSELI